ncbi:MHYT domain-containing protein [Actinomadura verrucosospora]|uniref:MHYT domain-containing protein n=1 Tax=Actinomadura verrucosospora TaxID=46165 RepID=UPI00156737FA|nr:MHYT domain-containing protein [Actinomadura verrucosospora]
MAHVHHFSYGPLTPTAAYLMSFVGSFLGLLCTSRARASTGRSRASWLSLAALAIGGTGIWVMHFIAMLGFSVSGMPIRYNVPITLLSCLTAIVVVAIGLFIIGFGGSGTGVIVTGGVVMGIGVVSMHYSGMAAMNMSGHIGYRPGLVVLSVVIALVAATAALWFCLRVRGLWATAGAALIMGVAVTGMHYTGMAAMRITMHPGMPAPSGATASDFLIPLIGGIAAVSITLLIIIAMAPSEDEIRADARFQERIAARRAEASEPGGASGPRSAGDPFDAR